MPRTLTPRGFSMGAATALSTSYASIAITGIRATDARSNDVPDECFLSWLHAKLSSTSGVTTITWYLCADSAGDVPLTDEIASTLIDQGTGSNVGGFARALEMSFSKTGLFTAGTIYFRAKSNANTPTITPYLFWER